MSNSRESLAEFLARGGKVQKLPTRKAKGFESLSKGLSANSTPSASERAKRAESKANRGLK